jgi:arylsulfatase
VMSPDSPAPAEEIARFRGHYTKDWDDLRQARLARQKALGIVGPEQRLPPRLPLCGAETATIPRRRRG